MTGETTEERERGRAARDMVMSIALRLAGEVIDKAEAAGLQQAHLVDTADTLNATWDMRVVFYREPMTVAISMQPALREDALAEQETIEVDGMQVAFMSAAEMMALFGVTPQQPMLQYVVPVAWVLAARGGL